MPSQPCLSNLINLSWPSDKLFYGIQTKLLQISFLSAQIKTIFNFNSCSQHNKLNLPKTDKYSSDQVYLYSTTSQQLLQSALHCKVKHLLTLKLWLLNKSSLLKMYVKHQCLQTAAALAASSIFESFSIVMATSKCLPYCQWTNKLRNRNKVKSVSFINSCITKQEFTSMSSTAWRLNVFWP